MQSKMARKPPMAITTDQEFLSILVSQNEEIIALLKRIAPTDEQTPADDGGVKLTGL